jgi:hypothetical protein
MVWCAIYEEESKRNLNMAIKSQNHVVDGCTTDVIPSRLRYQCAQARLPDGKYDVSKQPRWPPLGSMHERGAACSY